MLTSSDSTALRSPGDSPLVSVASLQRTLDSSISRKSLCTKSSRILIVDDEPAQIRGLKQYLSEAGFSNFVTTSDPTEVVNLIRQ